MMDKTVSTKGTGPVRTTAESPLCPAPLKPLCDVWRRLLMRLQPSTGRCILLLCSAAGVLGGGALVGGSDPAPQSRPPPLCTAARAAPPFPRDRCLQTPPGVEARPGRDA